MAGQIIRQVVEVPRKVQRLAWLTSSSPSTEALAWRPRVVTPTEPIVAESRPLSSRVPVWAGGSSPSVADGLPWRRRATAYADPAFSLLGLWLPPKRIPGWSPVIPPNPPGPPSHAGILKPFIERVPDAVPRRLARHTEKVSDLLNSLMRQGIVYQTAPGVWAIDTTVTKGNGPTGMFDSTFP